MLNLAELLMACSLLSITKSCPELDCYVSPNQSYLENGCLLGKIVLKKKNKKRTSKLTNIEIGGSKAKFFDSCLKDLHVSSNRNSSYVYRNQ